MKENRLIDHLKVGNKVWNILTGQWSTIFDIRLNYTYPILINTDIVWARELTADGTLVKFSNFPIIYLEEWHPEKGDKMPELPELCPFKQGELVWVRDNSIHTEWRVNKFLRMSNKDSHKYVCTAVSNNAENYWQHCLPYDAHPLLNNL